MGRRRAIDQAYPVKATRNRHPVLTDKQAAFVAELLANGGNRAAAYRVAYPEAHDGHALRVNASALARNPKVVEALNAAQAGALRAVERAVDRYVITAERIADELARLAFTRVDQLATVELLDGKAVVRVRPFAEVDGDALAAVNRLKTAADGTVTVDLTDKRQALMDLARLKGWVADKPVSSGNLVMLKIER